MLTPALLAAFTGCGQPSRSGKEAEGGPERPTLGQLAARTGRLFGTNLDDGVLPEDPLDSDPDLTAAAAREATLLAVTQCDMETVVPERGAWNIGPCLRQIQFASRHGMKVDVAGLFFPHDLTYFDEAGSPYVVPMYPTWLTALTANELEVEVTSFLRRIARELRGRVVSYLVVNEAVDDIGRLDEDQFLFRRLAGRGGSRYAIAFMFRAVRSEDPTATLRYNDAGGEEIGQPKAEAIYGLVRDLLARGVPIDAVGFQTHVSTRPRPNPEAMRMNLERFAALGLKDTPITEIEVPIDRADQALPLEQQLDLQRRVYRDMAGVCAQVATCRSFTAWGLSDRRSWLYGLGSLGTDCCSRASMPLLLDDRLRPKPAYFAVAEAFEGAR